MKKDMKKFTCCLYLLLAAFCATAVAQEEKPYNILQIEGMVPATDGQTIYYIKNVGTGLYVSYGGEWGKHCKESRAAHPFIVESNGDGTVAIASLAGYLESGTIWMDWAKETSKWTLQEVGGEYVNQYYLVGDYGRALTSVGNSAGVLGMAQLENTAAQRWIFLTEEEFQNRMLKATADKPFDATPLIKGAAFDLIDSESDLPQTPAVFSAMQPYLDNYWENYAANKKLNPWHCGVCPEDANDYNYCGVINGSNNAITITYTMELPAGTYSYSFEGFYKYMKKVIVQNYRLGNENGDPKITFSDNGTMTATVSVNGNSHALPRHENNAVYEENYISSTVAAAEFRDNDTYKKNGTFYLPSKQDVSIVITKAATTSSSTSGSIFWGDYTTTSYPNQIFIDDFTLLYFGDKQLDEEEINEDALKDSYVDANIDEIVENMFPDATEEEKAQLKEEIKQSVTENESTDSNISTIISSTVQDVKDTANDIKNEEIKEATKNNFSIDSDDNVINSNAEIISSYDLTNEYIKNPSFEKGHVNGSNEWNVADVEAGGEIDVKLNKDAYATEGTDGNNLFNSWDWGVRLTQDITGLEPGVYKMTVSLASDPGNTVVLIANDYEREVTMTKGKEVFEDFFIKFRVTDADNGTATIGVVGGNDGANWYKADNFRLEVLTDCLVLSETDENFMTGNQRAIDYWYAKLTLYRTIIANTNWNTFVVPFDIPASTLASWSWEVKELTASETDEEGQITLTFSDAQDGIKAGVPYMVRSTISEGRTEFEMKDVTVSTALQDVEYGDITFKGVYTRSVVPDGSFFINSNKFYLAVGNGNITKGYRAYFTPKTEANARSLGYRFASRGEDTEDGTTGIEEPATEEPTVVAIYTLGGVRIDAMQQGVNIVQMSDGSVVRVVIK